MAKELKHCKHPEDLEVNENVKAKAKDYIKKYMSKFGANYKKAQSPTPDDWGEECYASHIIDIDDK